MLFVVAGVFLAFCLVVFVGPPYLPTLKKQKNIALDLAKLQAGERLLELGCGDGRVLRAAARRGAYATGVEINPFLAFWAWATTRQFKGLVTVRWGNFWHTSCSGYDVIFIFGLQRIMGRIDEKVSSEVDRPVRLVSFAFQVPNSKPTTEQSGVYMYTYKP